MKDWKHCPRCGSSLEQGTDTSNPSVHCANCGFAKWDNPLPSTIALIVADGQVLLVRRSAEPERGKWDAVGGFLNSAESAEECVRREALEELGVQVSVAEPLATYPSTYGSTGLRTIGIAFRCSLDRDAEIRLSDENDAYRWFPLEHLPEVAFADVQAALRDLARGARGDHPTG